jgi:hypothetical protein
MKQLGLALAWLLSMTGATIADEMEVPPAFIGLSAGGEFCETRDDLDGYLGLKDLVIVGELSMFEGYPPRCGRNAPGTPLYYEPLEWVEYRSAWVLVARATTRENTVLYVYLDVRVKVAT